MKQNIYSIFDTAAGVYLRPFFLPSDGQAVRMFCDLAADKEHEIGKHPEDYSLCRIGMFDDNNAEVTDEKVAVLITGLEALARKDSRPGNQLDLVGEL